MQTVAYLAVAAMFSMAFRHVLQVRRLPTGTRSHLLSRPLFEAHSVLLPGTTQHSAQKLFPGSAGRAQKATHLLCLPLLQPVNLRVCLCWPFPVFHSQRHKEVPFPGPLSPERLAVDKQQLWGSGKLLPERIKSPFCSWLLLFLRAVLKQNNEARSALTRANLFQENTEKLLGTSLSFWPVFI